MSIFSASRQRKRWTVRTGLFIPKHDGKMRPLGIPSIEDRIIQQCIKQVLEPICEAKFYEYSYGFRPNRSAKHAIARCYHLMQRADLYYVVDIDIKGFFDNVDHSKLLKQIYSLGIRDKRVISIISKMFVTDESVEYNDNRISLFAAQNGQCAITKQILKAFNFHCHHKIPRKLGGNDSYQNLIIVTIGVHRLIHATKPEIIEKLIKENAINGEQLTKINKLRKLCELEEIKVA